MKRFRLPPEADCIGKGTYYANVQCLGRRASCSASRRNFAVIYIHHTAVQQKMSRHALIKRHTAPGASQTDFWTAVTGLKYNEKTDGMIVAEPFRIEITR
jgi:hypothetical protein